MAIGRKRQHTHIWRFYSSQDEKGSVIAMRGHWLSQTRKLNKHYQSSGNMAEKTGDGSKDLSPAKSLKKEERTIKG